MRFAKQLLKGQILILSPNVTTSKHINRVQMMINTEMTTVVVHLATNRASDFGSELPLKCIDYVRVITLPVFLPRLFSDDLHTFMSKRMPVRTITLPSARQILLPTSVHVHLENSCLNEDGYCS